MAELVLPKNSKVKDGKKYPLDSDSRNKKSFKIYRWDPEKMIIQDMIYMRSTWINVDLWF